MTTVAPALLGDVSTLLDGAVGPLGYPLVFVLAMVPFIEPFVVIPVAIGLGFDPLLTGVAAFAGSVTAVVAIVAAQERLLAWWARRSAGDDGADDSGTVAPDVDAADEASLDVNVDDAADDEASGRYARARRVGERYGLVGLALGGPPLVGLHLMAVVGAAIGPTRRATLGWLTVGLAVWTVLLVVGSVAGFAAVESVAGR